MPDWLNADFFTAVVIFYVINAVPSAMFGIALARRSGRPWWHGVLPGFFLPWFGLLFLTKQPAGEPYSTGPAKYSMVMLFVAGILVLISIWLPWVSGTGQVSGTSGSFEYSPNQVVVAAIIVWLLALGLIMGSIGLLFKGGFAVAQSTALMVSVIGGALAVMYYLFGPAGLFLSEARVDAADAQLSVVLGAGAKIALVALVTAYVAILVVPFGLKVRQAQLVAPAEPPAPNWGAPPPQTQWNQQAQTQWGSQPPQGRRQGTSW